jgi:pilus assembly protein Flp/PilA
MQPFLKRVRDFAHEDDGAQVIEYALIIAVVSITLVIALSKINDGSLFTDFITRVAGCLKGPSCT